jgi:hypothetical protein
MDQDTKSTLYYILPFGFVSLHLFLWMSLPSPLWPDDSCQFMASDMDNIYYQG